MLHRILGIAIISFGLHAGLAQADEPNMDAGIKAFEAGDLAGVQWNLEPFADKGDIKALSMLGSVYLDGRMAPFDPDRAVKYLLPAAKAGDANAQYQMAHLYMEGKGVVVDADQMVSWMKAAASHQHVEAMYEYGLMLLSGRYVAKDEKAGMLQIGGAAGAGHVLAMQQLGMAYYNGNIPSVPRDLKIAGQWFQATAQKGLPAAAYMMAILTLGDEAFGKADTNKAYAWALLARNRTRSKDVRDNAGRLVNSLGIQMSSQAKRDATRMQKEFDSSFPRLTDDGKLVGSEREKDEK